MKGEDALASVGVGPHFGTIKSYMDNKGCRGLACAPMLRANRAALLSHVCLVLRARTGPHVARAWRRACCGPTVYTVSCCGEAAVSRRDAR